VGLFSHGFYYNLWVSFPRGRVPIGQVSFSRRSADLKGDRVDFLETGTGTSMIRVIEGAESRGHRTEEVSHRHLSGRAEEVLCGWCPVDTGTTADGVSSARQRF
jgi:hypothetical protein